MTTAGELTFHLPFSESPVDEFQAPNGEWYATLHRDGTVKDSDKGTLWKAAYHLPRSIMRIALLFEDYCRNKQG